MQKLYWSRHTLDDMDNAGGASGDGQALVASRARDTATNGTDR